MSTMAALRIGGGTAPTPHLQNVVVTFRIGLAKVDLRRLACLVPWIEYDPRKFAAATMRLASPRSTCLLFGSGRGVCTGAKTECEARHAAYSYVCLLRRLGTPCAFEAFKVQNIVCAVHCNFRLDLASLAAAHTDACGYEPDLFPGLMYRRSAGDYVIVFLMFQSGKCVITGGRSQADITTQWESFYFEVVVHHQMAAVAAKNSTTNAAEVHNIGLVLQVDPSALLDCTRAPDDWASVLHHLRPEAEAISGLVARAGLDPATDGMCDNK